MLSTTVDEVKEAVQTLNGTVDEVKEAVQTLNEDVLLVKAELKDLKTRADEIKVQLETLTALFQQCKCGVIHCPLGSGMPVALQAVGNSQLAIVPAGSSDGHQAGNNSAGSRDGHQAWNTSASSSSWSGWAGWQDWNGMQQAAAGWQQLESTTSDLEEIPFPRPTWLRPPCPCLYANKECDENTLAEYFVYFKSRGHRKNETLCRNCTVAHRDELSGIMKIR